MRCLGTIEICQYINVRFNYFFSIIIMNFLFFINLFADFFKFFKCHLFNNIFKKSTENVCEQWDITETNNLIRLIIFDDKS